MPVERLAPSELRALARKYRVLAELRRRRQAARDQALAELQALAREFPGALLELDSLPLDEIDRRGEAVERALSRGAGERWMAWMLAYHADLRAALFIRRRVRAMPEIDETRANELLNGAARELGWHGDLAFVRAVARGPRGQLDALVLRRIALVFGERPEGIARALFTQSMR